MWAGEHSSLWRLPCRPTICAFASFRGESGKSTLLRKIREHNKRGKDEFKEPRLKLENDTEELTEKTSEPVDPTRRQESLESCPEEKPPSAQCGPKRSPTTTAAISTTTSMTHTSQPKNLQRYEEEEMRSNLFQLVLKITVTAYKCMNALPFTYDSKPGDDNNRCVELCSVERSQPCTARPPSHHRATNTGNRTVNKHPGTSCFLPHYRLKWGRIVIVQHGYSHQKGFRIHPKMPNLYPDLYRTSQ